MTRIALSLSHAIIANGGLAEVFVADLASLAAVRRLADEVLVRLPRLEVLINNVGGYWRSRHVTVDGNEHTFALNHLASFLLTGLLLPRLSADGHGRVVTVASNVQAVGRIHFEDLQGAGVTGRYFAKSAPKRSSKRSHDQAVAQRLWRPSEELVATNSAPP